MTVKKSREGKPRGRPQGPIRSEASAAVREMAKKIRDRRNLLGMTLHDVEIASMGLVSSASLSYVELGHEPKLATYVGICLALGVSLAEMLPSELSNILKKAEVKNAD